IFTAKIQSESLREFLLQFDFGMKRVFVILDLGIRKPDAIVSQSVAKSAADAPCVAESSIVRSVQVKIAVFHIDADLTKIDVSLVKFKPRGIKRSVKLKQSVGEFVSIDGFAAQRLIWPVP